MLRLSQMAYIEKMLEKFNMQGSKKGSLPISHGTKLSKDISPKTSSKELRMKGIPYASAIGSIMYAMLCIRPDVAYALSMTSRF